MPPFRHCVTPSEPPAFPITENLLSISAVSKELFAGRYELLQESPSGAGGRLFEARDTTTGECVALKVFRKQLTPSSEERADLEAMFARIRASEHPHLCRFHTLSLDEGYLVREWVHGFSFLELLRKRREIPGEEVVCLLDGIGEAIDFACQHELAPGGDLLTRLFVGFSREIPADQLAAWRGEPLSKWPDFFVKLNPLSISTFLPASEEDPMETVRNFRPKTSALLSPRASFALMLYELLGGPHLSGITPRYAPLPALNEAGNAVLRSAIENRRAASTCQALWEKLTAASALVPARKKVVPPPLPARRQLRIAEPLLSSVQAGKVLKLTPSDLTYIPIHLVTRRRFKIGRSLYQADFIARVLPETSENEKLTKEIGRVHVTAEVMDDRLMLADGNGAQPSVNGSSFNGTPLSAERLVPLDRAGVLALYKNYELDVLPLLDAADLGWEIANEKDWPGSTADAPTIRGAVVFKPRKGQATLRKTVWMFTRLDFQIESGEVVWIPAGTGTNAGTFFHHRGQFFLANLSLTDPPSVSGISLPPNTAAPMITGQVIILGGGRYTAEVT